MPFPKKIKKKRKSLHTVTVANHSSQNFQIEILIM